MTDTLTRTAPKRLSTLDKWLPLWIGLAMVVGLLLGRFVPALSALIHRFGVGGSSDPVGGLVEGCGCDWFSDRWCRLVLGFLGVGPGGAVWVVVRPRWAGRCRWRGPTGP